MRELIKCPHGPVKKKSDGSAIRACYKGRALDLPHLVTHSGEKHSANSFEPLCFVRWMKVNPRYTRNVRTAMTQLAVNRQKRSSHLIAIGRCFFYVDVNLTEPGNKQIYYHYSINRKFSNVVNFPFLCARNSKNQK